MSIEENIQTLWSQKFPTQHGEVSLSDIAATHDKIVLYFYPKDNTPGCTTEAGDFEANLAAFTALNAAVIGVSRDSVGSHQKFVDKLNLTFTLISDKESIICNAFDVIKEKNLYGKIGFGVERSTFVLDQTGNILHEWRKVKVPEHVQTVLKTLQG
ncbi:peroxiredoxin [Wohlfahrtiimonas chitiniclastica]|uniref:peroxiredoxin n=1 Tax=Wohlfahrtiimonas chitiniclastica TaxID=400946 RepID=UPI00036F171F|nr:peroxiredoxin [Wohlfahrtiimonas chitiniclastica]